MSVVEVGRVKEEIEAFLSQMGGGGSRRGFADNTIVAYRNDLYEMATFIEAECLSQGISPQWSSVNREILLSYLLNLKERNYRPTTIARKTASAKSFFKFLLREGRLENDLVGVLTLPRLKKTLPHTISVSEVRRLLAEPAKLSTAGAKRDKAMLELAYASGMRASDLMALNVGDVDLHNGCVRCTSRGSQERTIPLSQQAIKALQEYIESDRVALLRSEEEALFLNQRGERLTRQGFWQILKGYAKAAGLAADITPQTLRHSFAAHMLSRGVDLNSLKQLLGHANISSTQVYTHLTAAPPQHAGAKYRSKSQIDEKGRS